MEWTKPTLPSPKMQEARSEFAVVMAKYEVTEAEYYRRIAAMLEREMKKLNSHHACKPKVVVMQGEHGERFLEIDRDTIVTLCGPRPDWQDYCPHEKTHEWDVYEDFDYTTVVAKVETCSSCGLEMKRWRV
jgi:hypothetical protein